MITITPTYMLQHLPWQSRELNKALQPQSLIYLCDSLVWYFIKVSITFIFHWSFIRFIVRRNVALLWIYTPPKKTQKTLRGHCRHCYNEYTNTLWLKCDVRLCFWGSKNRFFDFLWKGTRDLPLPPTLHRVCPLVTFQVSWPSPV